MASLLELKDYCNRKSIPLEGEEDKAQILKIIKEYERVERLDDAKKGPPYSVFTAEGKEIVVKYATHLTSRTFIDPDGLEQARTFAIVVEPILKAPVGTELIVGQCNHNDELIPIFCNYPDLDMVFNEDNPLMVFNEKIVIYNGQSGVKVKETMDD